MQNNAFEDLCNAATYQNITQNASIEAMESFKRKIVYDIHYAAKSGKRSINFQIPVILTDAQINSIIQELRDKDFTVKYIYWADYDLTVSW